MPRSYGGATRVGRQGMEVQFKKNRQYIENLKKVIGTVGKKAYGEFIANALHNVVKETVKDSGRAAANWNLSFGGVSMMSEWDPKEYKQTYNEGKGPIGDRGDRHKKTATKAQIVWYYKGFHYGYVLSGKELILVPHGRIVQNLKIGQPGNPPAVYLYNPIFGPANAYYSNNAFKSELTGDSITAGIDSKVAGSIPRLIRETAMEYKFPLTYKK